MGIETDNFGYPKPGEDDFYDIGVFNRAMDMVDKDLKDLGDKSRISWPLEPSQAILMCWVRVDCPRPAAYACASLTKLKACCHMNQKMNIGLR